MASIVKTVQPGGGGDYTSVAAAVAAEAQDLTSVPEQRLCAGHRRWRNAVLGLGAEPGVGWIGGWPRRLDQDA